MDAIFFYFSIITITCATCNQHVETLLEDFVGKVDSETGWLLKSGGHLKWRPWHAKVSETGNWTLMTGNRLTFKDHNTVMGQVQMVVAIDHVLLVAAIGQQLHTFRISPQNLSTHAHISTSLSLTSVGLQAFYEGLTAKSYVFTLLDNCSVTWYTVQDDHLTPTGSIPVACDVTQLRLFTTSKLHVLLLTWPSHGPLNIHIAENSNFEGFKTCVATILLKDIRDVEVFQLNQSQDVLLIFATRDNTLVYRYATSSRQVAPHQKLATRGRSLKVVRRQSRSFLLVLGDNNSVATYEWTGQLFRWRAETAARGATGMAGTSFGEGILLTSPSGICQTLQWDASYRGFSASNLSACLTAGEDAHGISMVKVLPDKILVAVPVKNSIQLSLLASNTIQSSPSTHLEELEDGTRRVESLVDTLYKTSKLNEDFAYKVADLGARLTTVKGLLAKAEDSLSTDDIVVENFIAHDLQVTTLNGIHVDRFLEDAVRKGDRSIVRGVKTWEGGSHLDADLEVIETLNSIPKDQLLTRTTQQTVSGPMVFQDTVHVRSDIIVAGKVNGVKLSTDAVGLSGHQMITGFKIFEDQIQVSRTTSVHGDCNGINLTTLANNVLRSSVPQYIRGKKTFTSVNVGGDVVTDGRVCGQDTRRLFGSAVTLDFPTRIFAPKTFTKTVAFLGTDLSVGTLNTVRVPLDLKRPRRRVSRQVNAQKVVIHGDLVVGKFLNGHDVHQLQADVILKHDEHTTMSGTMTFTKPQVLQGTVSIEGPLNDALLQTDFVHRGKPSAVTGLKTFTSPVKFLQRMDVSETVDGVDIGQLAQHSMNTVNGGTVGGHKTFAGGITIRGKMLSDGIDVLAREALRQADSVIVSGQTHTYTLNKRHLDHWVSNTITLATDQNLHGACMVSGEVSSPGDVVVKGTLNGIYMDSLVEDTFRLNRIHQVVTGKKTFNGTVRTPSTIVNKGINGFDLDNIAAKSIKITGNAFVPHLLGDEMRVYADLTVEGALNGLNFTAFAQDCVTRIDETPTIKGVTTFNNLQVLDGDVAVSYGDEFLTTSTNQTITGSFHFCNNLTAFQTNWNPPKTKKMGNVIFKGSVNTRRLSVSQDGCQQWRRFSSDAITNDNGEPISISANKTITGNVAFHRNLQVQQVNGVHVDEIYEKMAINGAQMERGRKTFDVREKKTFHTDVTVEGRVQVEKTAFLRRRANRRLEVVYGPLTIDGSFTIDGNVTSNMKSGTMVYDEVRVPGDVTADTLNGIRTCLYRCDAENSRNLQLEEEVSLDEPLEDVHIFVFQKTTLVIASCDHVRCIAPTRVYRYSYRHQQLVYKGTVDATSVIATHATKTKMFLIARKSGGMHDAALWVTEDPNVPFARWASIPGNRHIDHAVFYTVNHTLLVLITGHQIPPTVLRVGTRQLNKVFELRDFPSGVSIGKVLTLNDNIYFLLGNPSLGICYLVVPSQRFRVVQTLRCPRVTTIAYCPLRTSKGIAVISQKDTTMVYTFTDDYEPLKLEMSIPSRGTSRNLDYNCQAQHLIEISPKFGVKVFARKGESGFQLMTNLINDEVTDVKAYGSGRRLRLVVTDGRHLRIYRPWT